MNFLFMYRNTPSTVTRKPLADYSKAYSKYDPELDLT